MTGIGGALGLSITQNQNALGIIAAVKARGWDKKAAYIAVATALVESGMRVLANGNVPDSLNHPHEALSWSSDGLGHDHASVGMFQQQTGTAYANPGTTTMGSAIGWGIPADLMDPVKSTALFLNALSNVNWTAMSNWEAAQAVQHSAFANGSNYASQDGRARSIVDTLWDQAQAQPGSDDMSDADVAKIIAHIDQRWPMTRLAKFDIMSYQMSKQIVPAVSAIRKTVGAAVADDFGADDVTALAMHLIDELGPEVSAQVVAAIGARLTATK